MIYVEERIPKAPTSLCVLLTASAEPKTLSTILLQEEEDGQAG